MTTFICPVCKNALDKNNNALHCKNNHCFDLSKFGYVNLLQNQKSSVKRHGDDKLMVIARQDFLNKGYYNLLLDELAKVVLEYIPSNAHILDAGCGECFYTEHIYSQIKHSGKNVTVTGIDISKDALKIGAKRCRELHLAVASVFDIPVGDATCDMILNLFAPISYEECTRMLKKNGVLIRVIPLENHLWELKQAVYDDPYENKIDDVKLNDFCLLSNIKINDTINIDNNLDLQNLFKMTPYYYKTKKEDQDKLELIPGLETQIAFSILVYKKG